MTADKMHETIVRELLDGDTLKRAGLYGRDVHLVGLILDEGAWELIDAGQIAILATGGLTDLMDLQSEMEKKCRKLCEEYLASDVGQDYLNERIRDYEEDMREEAAEARREAKREVA